MVSMNASAMMSLLSESDGLPESLEKWFQNVHLVIINPYRADGGGDGVRDSGKEATSRETDKDRIEPKV